MAAQRRTEREEKRRQKELERRLKEQAKLSALEQARLSVEAHENELELLLSIHKEQTIKIDWRALASSMPPPEPMQLARHELAALLKGNNIEEAREVDNQEFQAAQTTYTQVLTGWERTRSLARRVIAGDSHAYTEAISASPAFSEISNMGSSIHVAVHDARLIECELKVNGSEIIPSEAKSLTTTGKLAVKPMPKARFHEVYQDYVCSSILRLGREMFALLPVTTVILTATVDSLDTSTGRAAELPVLSVAITRSEIERLDFDHVDPWDAVGSFQHRGDVTTSRKSGAFIPITPLGPADIAPPPPETLDFAALVARVKQFRGELSLMLLETSAAETVTPGP